MYRLGNRILHAGNKLVYSSGIPVYTYIYLAHTNGIFSKIKISDLSVVLNSADLGSPSFYAQTLDNNYLYSYDYDDKIKKINTSNLTIAASSGVISNDCEYMVADNDYLYVRKAINPISKVNKSDLTVAATSVNTFSFSYGFAVDENYLYITTTARRIIKYNKSDLTVAATSGDLLIVPYILCVDDNYLYFMSNTVIKKVNKSDLTVAATSASLTATQISMTLSQDNNYLYWSTTGNNKKINKSDLSVALSVDVANTQNPYWNILTENHLFTVGNDNKICKYNLSDLTLNSIGTLPYSIYYMGFAGYK